MEELKELDSTDGSLADVSYVPRAISTLTMRNT